MNNTSKLIVPTHPQERLIILDIIRGFALLGILLVNAPSLNSPIWIDNSEFAFQSTWWDETVTRFIFLFAVEKFYPIFSLLFGIGAMIFMENAAHHGAIAWRIFLRRLSILFSFGLIHAGFIWWGDVLITYAVIGICLVLFYRWSARWILIIALFILLLLTVVNGTLAYIDWQESMNAETVIGSKDNCDSEAENDVSEEAINEQDMDLIYRDGSFWEITWKRMEDYYQVNLLGIVSPQDFRILVVYLNSYLQVLAIFLLGAWVQKKRIFHDLKSNQALLHTVGNYTIATAFITNLLSAHSEFFANTLWPIEGLSLGMVYVYLLTIGFQQQAFWQKVLRPLAAVGKLSLTCYIGSNLVLSILFYGYGFGLYGSMGPSEQIWITLSIFAGAVIFSNLWLKYFRFGPLEYIWRSLTYGKTCN